MEFETRRAACGLAIMSDQVPKLTLHQRKILAALVALDREHPHIVLAGGGFGRKMISNRAQLRAGAHYRWMVPLWKLGLIEPDDLQLANAVATHRCTCGCDRWRPMEKGRQLVSTWRIYDRAAEARR